MAKGGTMSDMTGCRVQGEGSVLASTGVEVHEG